MWSEDVSMLLLKQKRQTVADACLELWASATSTLGGGNELELVLTADKPMKWPSETTGVV